MKKFLIAALAALTIGSSAFAADETKSDASKLSSKVKSCFEKQFKEAQNVSWTVRENFIKASFNLVGQDVEAFFGQDGEMIGVSRKVSIEKLPLSAIAKIRKDYPGYDTKESIEFEKDGETNYYVSLEKGGKKQILQVSLYGSVSVYHQ